jgi:hypothetical protein
VAHEQDALKLRKSWEKGHPSPQGPAAAQATFHRCVGDHAVTVATLPHRPAAQQRDDWRRARAEFAEALALRRQVANPKPDRGAAEIKSLEDAIARCDQALAALDARPPGR